MMRGISSLNVSYRGNKEQTMGAIRTGSTNVCEISPETLKNRREGWKKELQKGFQNTILVGWHCRLKDTNSYHSCDNPSSFSPWFINSRLCVAREAGLLVGSKISF